MNIEVETVKGFQDYLPPESQKKGNGEESHRKMV